MALFDGLDDATNQPSQLIAVFLVTSEALGAPVLQTTSRTMATLGLRPQGQQAMGPVSPVSDRIQRKRCNMARVGRERWRTAGVLPRPFRFGVALVASKVQVSFHDVGDNAVCQVDVLAATSVMIVHSKDKGGQDAQTIYVRNGNASNPMTVGELPAFLKERFR